MQHTNIHKKSFSLNYLILALALPLILILIILSFNRIRTEISVSSEEGFCKETLYICGNDNRQYTSLCDPELIQQGTKCLGDCPCNEETPTNDIAAEDSIIDVNLPAGPTFCLDIDANNNGIYDFEDLNSLISQLGINCTEPFTSVCGSQDKDFDTYITLRDFAYLISKINDTCPTTPYDVDVMTIVYLGGHDPNENPDYNGLINSVEAKIEDASRYKGYQNVASHKNINFNINQKIVRNGTPPQNRLNCESYLPQIQAGNWTVQDWQTSNCWGSGTANYNQMLLENEVCEKLNQGLIDEVWFFSFGYGGFWEATTTGPGAIQTNGPVIQNTDCLRSIHIMGFNYEASAAFAMHSFGHRIEGTLKAYIPLLYNQFDTNQERYNYTYGVNYYAPNPVPSCGNIHWPPNATSHYQYDNTTNVVWTDCMTWSPDHSVGREYIHCATWSCTQEGFLTWWMQNIPGDNLYLNPNGRNWWGLIANRQTSV